jgi:hypothetical protein
VILAALVKHFAIHWDPGLRGVLIVATAVAILVGSIYLVLGTNLGARVGFLVTIAGLSGWIAMMGFVWSMYGIGYKGTAAHWNVEEVVTSRSATDLGQARLSKAHDLSKWRKLGSDDKQRADAGSAATAALTTKGSGVQLFASDQDYKLLDAYTIGGKGHSFWERHLPAPHPPHYTIIQVQPVKAQDVPFGATPPPAQIDTSRDIESVILVRDLGKLRVPSFLIGSSALIVFAVSCATLHRRDKAAMAARAAAAVA